LTGSGRLRRFLHLERARPDRPEAEPAREGADPTGERIAGVERPTAAPAGASRGPQTGAQLGRFGPEPEPRIELADTEGRRAFIRCRRCGADANVFATECGGCGISLDTPEQHDFDERFWAARQAEADREARIAAERAEIRARAEAEEARERRAAAEAMAREVGEAERRRIGRWGGWGGRAGRSGEWNPLGLRLLRRIPDARWHVPAMAIASGVAASLAAYGIHAHSLLAFLVGGAALVLLLVHVPE
jgi:hypothetical protein